MENKTADKVLKILEDMAKLTDETIPDLLNEAFKELKLIPQNYTGFKAAWNYKNIKENDFLIFDLDDKEAKDGEIYLLKLKGISKPILLYGEYKEKREVFYLGENSKDFIDRDQVLILGKLSSVQKYKAILKLT